MKEGWKFVTMENGEQFAMIVGMMSMHKLYADNWDSQILVSKSYLAKSQVIERKGEEMIT